MMKKFIACAEQAAQPYARHEAAALAEHILTLDGDMPITTPTRRASGKD